MKVNPLRHASVEADRCRPFTLLGGDGWLGIVECGNDLWGRLHKLQKYALSRVGKGLISFRVYECDQVPRGALPDATAREADALFGEVLHCRLDGIDPESNVVERRHVNLWGLVGVNGRHQVELDGGRTPAKLKDILVHVFRFRFEAAQLG